MTIHGIFHYRETKVRFCFPHKINCLLNQFWQHIRVLHGTSEKHGGSMTSRLLPMILLTLSPVRVLRITMGVQPL